jgi:hypothetical protein
MLVTLDARYVGVSLKGCWFIWDQWRNPKCGYLLVFSSVNCDELINLQENNTFVSALWVASWEGRKQAVWQQCFKCRTVIESRLKFSLEWRTVNISAYHVYLSLPVLPLPVLTVGALPNNLHLYQQCCWNVCCVLYVFGLRSLLQREHVGATFSIPNLQLLHVLYVRRVKSLGVEFEAHSTADRNSASRQPHDPHVTSFLYIDTRSFKLLSGGTSNRVNSKNLTCTAWQLNNVTEVFWGICCQLWLERWNFLTPVPNVYSVTIKQIQKWHRIECVI